ncbi:MAG: hypothetical protein WCQ99_16545 [Pseudomonadota bacterium]
MTRENTFSPAKFLPIFTAAVYLAIGTCLLPFYRYQINPDGISYISIAQKYVAGECYHAINGYWSPLFSWLLIPGLYLRVEPLLAAKMLNLFVGMVVILSLCSFVRKFQIRQRTQFFFLFILIPLVLDFSYAQITPDLLTASVLIFYLNAIFDVNYPNKSRSGILCGIIGGLAYFSKHYCFLFFILHFPVMHAIHYFRDPSPLTRRNILRHFIKGLTVFLLMCSPWIGLISYKYGKLLFSTAGSLNLANLHPQAAAFKIPSFIEPPGDEAYSVWDDPYYALQQFSWNPFASIRDMKHWVKVFFKHVCQILLIFINFSYASFFIVVLYLLYMVLLKPKKIISESPIVFSVVSIVIYATGYCLIHLEDRFFIITFFLFMLIGFYVIDKIDKNSFYKIRYVLMLSIFLISF